MSVVKYPRRYKRERNVQSVIKLNSTKKRFTKIYQDNVWASKESRSGEGSEFNYTKSLRDGLPGLIKKYSIKSVVDAACGDFYWMKFVLPQVDVEYHGFDIVDELIEQNNQQYSSNKIQFSVADICRDQLPKADLLIIRDCLFHLSYNDINYFLNNIRDVDYKYMLVTTNIVDEDFKNADIMTGDWRLINLYDWPFNFNNKSVLEHILDCPKGYSIKNREMVLIEKQNIPIALRIY